MDQTRTTPATPPNVNHVSHRNRQVALAVLVGGLLALLIWRTYAPQFGFRPTDTQPPSKQVNLNSADRVELLQVPGIGPQLADAILSHRQNVGRFDQVEDLQHVPGVGPKTLDKLRPWLHVDAPMTSLSREPDLEKLERKAKPNTAPGLVRSGKIQAGEPPINLNSASEAELARLPGIGPALAARIAADRGEGYKTVDEVKRVRGIGVKTLEAIRPFVTVRGEQTAGK